MPQRRLAAIVCMDVAGYARLMGADEEGTLERLKTIRREIVDPAIREHGGRVVKTSGDGLLIEFPSVVEAIQAAVEFQVAMARRNADEESHRHIAFRVGVNIGDVIADDGDLHGDGVNVAARLEQLADPGAVYVSRAVRDQIRDRLPLGFDDLGELEVKNIARPLRVFRLTGAAASARSSGASSEPERSVLALPDRPSLAVLPFANLSGDATQDYFADGIVEDIITALSHVRWFFVVARNSSFAYKGRSVDVKQVARELGVRYVLEGSVRKATNRVRVTGQLIDTTSGTHIWADRFDSTLEDIFDLQDRITESVVGAIEPSLRRAEIERARRKRPDRLDAYDLYLRALPHAYANTSADTDAALRLLEGALRLDPNYASAHAHAAWCREQRFMRGGFAPEDRAAAEHHARSALAVGEDDPQALSVAAFVLAIITHDYETAIGVLDQALALNGNSALALGFSALVHAFSENHERAIDHGLRAVRLSPFDRLNYHPYVALALSHLFTGRLEEATSFANKAIQANPGFSVSHATMVACYAALGRLDAARAAAQRLLEIAPGFTITGFVRTDFLRPELMQSFAAALRKSGLPE